MKAVVGHAQLHINGRYVGDVRVHGWEGAWGIGEFRPKPDFLQFAVLFGAWSLLMHAEDDESGLSRDAADELRKLERQIDGLHIRLYLEEEREWRDVGQVNIDGTLVEWKETWRNQPA